MDRHLHHQQHRRRRHRHLTAIGVIQNNQGGQPIYNSSHQFLSTTPGTSDILLAYTYYGDTNLDGKVDGSDYTLIDNAYSQQGAALASEVASPTAQVAAVPEPVTLWTMGLLAAGMLGRRNRRRLR